MFVFRFFSIVFLVGTMLITPMAPADPDNLHFPEDAGVINITQPPFGAKGDGVTDDTAAFQAAVAKNSSLIFIPDGTYLISDTFRFSAGARRSHRIILQGQSRDGTVIRLKDRATGFQNPNEPQAMMYGGRAPAQRFRHSLRNLTFDTGSGNPGAIAVQYMANNQGTLRDVTLRSSDPQAAGVIGLDLGYTNENGPALIENVRIEGFDIGIDLKYSVNSMVFLDLELEGQRVAGIRNQGQSISIQNLHSESGSPAILHLGRSGLLTLIDSTLISTAGAENQPAIIAESQVMLRNVKGPGYAEVVRVEPTMTAPPGGDVIVEYVSHPAFMAHLSPPKTLGLAMKRAPSVPWDDPADWASVLDFGEPESVSWRAAGKTRTAKDWAGPLQRAIDSGASVIYFPRTVFEYGLFSEVILRGKVRRIMGMESTFRSPPGAPRGRLITGEGASDTVVIERFDPLYADISIVHRAKRNLVVRNCIGFTFETEPGAGDLFLLDISTEHPGKEVPEDFSPLHIRGSNVWAWQLNPESNAGMSKVHNEGGHFWALGIKTEGDTTCIVTDNGGKSEMVGGFIYANSAREKDPLFIVKNGAMSATFAETVIRDAPFETVLIEERNGEERRLTRTDFLPRGGGSMAPLLVAFAGPEVEHPPGEVTGVKAQSRGTSGILIGWQDDQTPIDGFRIRAWHGDRKVAEVVVGPSERRARIDGLPPGTEVRLNVAAFNSAGLGPESETTATTEPAWNGDGGTGLRGQYFQGRAFEAQRADRVDPSVDFRIDYRYKNRRGYGSGVGLLWSSPSQFEQIVPTSQLYP